MSDYLFLLDLASSIILSSIGGISEFNSSLISLILFFSDLVSFDGKISLRTTVTDPLTEGFLMGKASSTDCYGLSGI